MTEQPPRKDPAREQCRQGWHDDPDNSGSCIYCRVILDLLDDDTDPNDYRRRQGWPDVPTGLDDGD